MPAKMPLQVSSLPGLNKIKIDAMAVKWFEYLQDEGTKLNRRPSKHTLKQYSVAIRTYYYFTDVPLKKTTRPIIEKAKSRYREAMETAFDPWLSGADKPTRKKIFSRIDDRLYIFLYSLQSFFNFLIIKGYYGDKNKVDEQDRFRDNPLVGIKKPRYSIKSPRKPYTPGEKTDILYACQYGPSGTKRVYANRNKLLILLGMALALRTSEILEACFDWFKTTFNNLEVKIPTGVLKGHWEDEFSIRTVPKEILPLLSEYIELCLTNPEKSGGKPPYLFDLTSNDLIKMMWRYGKQMGIYNCCWHRFRNTIASEMDEMGFSKSDRDFKGGWKPTSNTSDRYVSRSEASLLRRVKEFDKLSVVV